MKYVIRDRETGTVIEESNTLEEAKEIVKNYENLDLLEGTYTPNFYEIISKA